MRRQQFFDPVRAHVRSATSPAEFDRTTHKATCFIKCVLTPFSLRLTTNERCPPNGRTVSTNVLPSSAGRSSSPFARVRELSSRSVARDRSIVFGCWCQLGLMLTSCARLREIWVCLLPLATSEVSKIRQPKLVQGLREFRCCVSR